MYQLQLRAERRREKVILDAVVYAITGRIPKLDELPAAKKGSSYYLNRFHAGGVGTITLTLVPAGGGAEVDVTVRRQIRTGVFAIIYDKREPGAAQLIEIPR